MSTEKKINASQKAIENCGGVKNKRKQLEPRKIPTRQKFTCHAYKNNFILFKSYVQ